LSLTPEPRGGPADLRCALAPWRPAVKGGVHPIDGQPGGKYDLGQSQVQLRQGAEELRGLLGAQLLDDASGVGSRTLAKFVYLVTAEHENKPPSEFEHTPEGEPKRSMSIGP
jgi:hypothetical protein